MNLFNEIVGGLTGGTSPGGGLAGSILEMLNNRQGGISGLAEAFTANGLGHLVSSWIGTGSNLPVSAEQIQQVLGSEQVEALAQKAGIPAEAVGSQLAELLPGIIDKLTPGGQVPAQGTDLMSAGMGLLKGLMSKGTSAG